MAMRTLIVSEFVTLDGVMEAPGGEPTHPHTGWVGDLMGPETEQSKFEEVLAAETLLLGRVTYESFAGAWPTYQGEFADRMNGMEKVVVSNTLTESAWTNTRVLSGDVVEGVTALKQGEGGPILVNGSRMVVHALLDHDLVDELRLMRFPVSIGGGLRVFPDNRHRTAWELIDSRTFPGQVREDIYRRA
jgi:dihydrofolate reductase